MRSPMLVALAVAASSCTGGTPAPPAPGDRPPTVRVIGRNLILYPGREIRFGFEPAEPLAHLIATFRPDTARMTVCPLENLGAQPDPKTCRGDVRSGVRDEVRSEAMTAFSIELEGDAAVPLDVDISYAERGRSFGARIPRIPAPPGDRSCDDNACNPFFELVPTRSGPFEARASWSGPAGTLVLLEGRVLARSQTATGIPYAEEARAEGDPDPPLAITARLAAGDEYALAFRHAGRSAEPLLGVSLEATWP